MLDLPFGRNGVAAAPAHAGSMVGEINKMRSAYGAPLPADQVGRLADYLFRINGSPASHTAANDGGIES